MLFWSMIRTLRTPMVCTPDRSRDVEEQGQTGNPARYTRKAIEIRAVPFPFLVYSPRQVALSVSPAHQIRERESLTCCVARLAAVRASTGRSPDVLPEVPPVRGRHR